MIQCDRCHFKKRKFGHTKRHQGCSSIEGRAGEEAARERPSENQGEKTQETNPVGTLILDLRAPALREERWVVQGTQWEVLCYSCPSKRIQVSCCLNYVDSCFLLHLAKSVLVSFQFFKTRGGNFRTQVRHFTFSHTETNYD